MQTIVDVNPLKPGKVEAYKAFTAELNGPRKKQFVDLLMRYGLHTSHAYFHKIRDVDFVVVVHIAEDNARELLKNFTTSTHPTDQWFVQQLSDLIDLSPLNGASNASTPIFALDIRSQP